jgi:hypothetical protein
MTFAEKYPAYMAPQTARALLAISRARSRGMRERRAAQAFTRAIDRLAARVPSLRESAGFRAFARAFDTTTRGPL